MQFCYNLFCLSFLTKDTENQEDEQNAMQEDNDEASDEYNLGMK